MIEYVRGGDSERIVNGTRYQVNGDKEGIRLFVTPNWGKIRAAQTLLNRSEESRAVVIRRIRSLQENMKKVNPSSFETIEALAADIEGSERELATLTERIDEARKIVDEMETETITFPWNLDGVKFEVHA